MLESKLDIDSMRKLEQIRDEIHSQYGYKLSIGQVAGLLSLGIEMGYFKGIEDVADIGKGRWKTSQGQ